MSMSTAVAFVARSPVSCWRVFTDAAMFPAWIPGLRKSRVITTDESGRPQEIMFEFATSRTYSLVYTYDDEQREVRWEPHANKRDAVRGFARFEPLDDGTQITYRLEPAFVESGGVTSDVGALVTAFVDWMNVQRPSHA